MRKIAIMFIAVFAMTVGGCSGSKPAGTGTAKDGDELAIEKATLAFMKATDEAGYKVIGTEDLKVKIDAKENMTIVDTMPADSYKSGRIPTAVNAELPKALADVTPEQRAAFLSVLPADKDAEIVVYCGFVGCPRSHVAGLIAIEEGYTNIIRHAGGIVGWKDAGYEVEK